MEPGKRKGNRSTNNPYLTGGTAYQVSASHTSLGRELKRLCGLPFCLPAALLLVVLPALLALGGALDLLSVWVYTVSHHTGTDPRPTLPALDCLMDRSKELCRGAVWLSPASPKRIALYPWHGVDLLRQFEPYLFLAYFALAVLSFSAIGSPNAKRIGQTIFAVAGFKRGSKQTANRELGLAVKKPSAKKGKEKEKEKEEILPGPPGLIPALEVEATPAGLTEAWQSSLILGGYLPRMWESDPGYFYLDRDVPPVPYWLTLNILRTNLVIVAPQGSGKTSSVYRPLLSFMRRSNSVAIFWDSKGDDFNPALFDYNFDPQRPAGSIKLNIFAGQNPAQAGERLAEALIPDLGGEKQYFSNNAKDALAALTAAHAICFDRNPALVDLLDYLTTPAKVQTLYNMVLENQRGPEHYEEGLRLATLLRRVLQLSENKSADVLGSLANALSPLVTTQAAKVLVTNPEQDAYTIEGLLRKPGLVRLSLPVANNPRIAPIIGRLVLAQFTYAVLSPECNRTLFKLAAVDEARHFITENVANGMAQARSNNAGYVLALQALTQIKQESLLDTIFAVSGTKIVMTGVGEKDARRFSDTFGQLDLPYVNHTQGQSQAVSYNRGSSTTRGQEYEFFSGQSGHEARYSRGSSQGRGQTSSQNTASSITTRVRPRFFPAEIRELNQFQAVIESSDYQGRRWFAQVIDMRASTVARLEDRVLEQLIRLRGSGKKALHKQPDVKLPENPSDGRQEVAVSTAAPVENAPAKHATNDPTPANPIRATVRFMPVNKLPAGQESEVKVDRKPGVFVTAQVNKVSEPQPAANTFPLVTQPDLPLEPSSESQSQETLEADMPASTTASGSVPPEVEPEVKEEGVGKGEFIQATFLIPADTGTGKLPAVTEASSPVSEQNQMADEKNISKGFPGAEKIKDAQGLL